MFAAYPVDRQSLGVRIECLDCRLERLNSDIITVANGWLWAKGDADDAAGLCVIWWWVTTLQVSAVRNGHASCAESLQLRALPSTCKNWET